MIDSYCAWERLGELVRFDRGPGQPPRGGKTVAFGKAHEPAVYVCVCLCVSVCVCVSNGEINDGETVFKASVCFRDEVLLSWREPVLC